MRPELLLLAAIIALGACGDRGAGSAGAPVNAEQLQGMWTLVITPVQKRGLRLSIEREPEGPIQIDPDNLGKRSASGAMPVLALDVSTREGRLVSCAESVENMPTTCELQDDRFVVRMGSDGEPTMVVSLTSQPDGSFTGPVRFEAPVLPGGGLDFGTARMVPKV